MSKALFSPLKVGAYTLSNRIVLAPLTRCRADPGTFAPNDMMAAHYAARADAGLLIAEATVISEEARGFPNTPGVYSDAQVAGCVNPFRPYAIQINAHSNESISPICTQIK